MTWIFLFRGAELDCEWHLHKTERSENSLRERNQFSIQLNSHISLHILGDGVQEALIRFDRFFLVPHFQVFVVIVAQKLVFGWNSMSIWTRLGESVDRFCFVKHQHSSLCISRSWILIEFNSLDGKIRLARVDWWVASSSVHFLGVISNQSCSRPRLHCKANSLCCARQWQLTSFAFRLHFQFASSIIRRATLSAFHDNCLSLLSESFWAVGYKDRLSNRREITQLSKEIKVRDRWKSKIGNLKCIWRSCSQFLWIHLHSN